MADKVPITAGTGTDIATDDAGANGHVQVVKLALSADGSATPITADANGLEVQLSALPALPATTATLANVGDSASSVTLRALNAARLGLTIYNDSTAILYVKLGATASATSFTTKVYPETLYELPSNPIYTGVVDGIWASDAGGNARVTELTA